MKVLLHAGRSSFVRMHTSHLLKGSCKIISKRLKEGRVKNFQRKLYSARAVVDKSQSGIWFTLTNYDANMNKLSFIKFVKIAMGFCLNYICLNKKYICLIWSRRSLLVVRPLASRSRNQQLETTQLRSFKEGWPPSLPHWTHDIRLTSCQIIWQGPSENQFSVFLFRAFNASRLLCLKVL